MTRPRKLASPFRYFNSSLEVINLEVMMMGWTPPDGILCRGR